MKKNIDTVKPESVTTKDHVRKIVDLTENISQALIPHVKKDEMRNILKNLKKTLDDKERALKASMASNVVEKAKEICQAFPDAAFLVKELQASNNTKALDSALKQVRVLNPETAAMFISVDEDSKKIFCLSSVPKSKIDKGLKANEWVQHISGCINGKGGGKAESAQASGTNYDKINEVLKLFASC